MSAPGCSAQLPGGCAAWSRPPAGTAAVRRHPPQAMRRGGSRRTRPAGFSLVEVLVALVVIAVGMLGIAKMHALALATTGQAGTRSLVAIEAAGLASSMHANRDYWSTTTQYSYNVNVQGGTASVDVFSTAQSCVATCTSPQMAAYDLQQFGAALAQIVPAANANITCQGNTPPQSCIITVTWVESLPGLSSAPAAVAISSEAISSGASGPGAPSSNLLQQPQYVLYVEP